MFKTPAVNIMNTGLPVTAAKLYGRFREAVNAVIKTGILTGDLKYAWNFSRNFKKELYEKHIEENYINCIFCSNLIRTGCHRHCLKCGAGTYIKCGPSLPGILYNESVQKGDSDDLHVPWYFMEPCGHFKRLPQKKYLGNLHSPLSQAGIYDFEALEGLEKGISQGTRPCHVCAAVGYEPYIRCSAQAGFDIEAPCSKAYAGLKSFYTNKTASKKVS